MKTSTTQTYINELGSQIKNHERLQLAEIRSPGNTYERLLWGINVLEYRVVCPTAGACYAELLVED